MVVGELSVETELAVVGGGPGGYSAAFRAAEIGVATTVIDDRDSLGGAWLHEGCVLSKELLHVADTIRRAEHARAFGLEFDRPRLDLDRIRARLRESVGGFAAKLDELCRAHGVAHVRGRARFESSRQLAIAGNPTVPRLRFRRAIVASGSVHLTLADAGVPAPIESPRVIGPSRALALDAVPARLLVVGGSASALELATVYAALGSRVTIINKGDSLLPQADPDLAAILARQLEGAMESVRLGTTIAAMEERDDGLAVTFAGPESTAPPQPHVFDLVLVAVGRRPSVGGLGLERTAVRTDDAGRIPVNEQLRTADPRIFAVGDVLGEPMLAMKAKHQGRIAAEVVAGWGSAFDARAVPTVLFTDPQIAWCGLTEAEAVAEGRQYEVGCSRWDAGSPTSVLRRCGGLTKIIYEPASRLVLGVGIVGENAGELISEAALAIEMGAVTTDLASTIHSHPTCGESIGDAARGAGGTEE